MLFRSLEFISIEDAIKVNKNNHHGEMSKVYTMMIERDTKVLEMLLEELG